jgi:hypothetical protein
MRRFRKSPDCFDECSQVTITSLKQLGYFRPDIIRRGSYRWTRGGRPSGSICITVNLALRYVELEYHYFERPINYRVKLESIPKHFGGCEWYFVCPATGKRCRTLYGIGELFLSRFAFPSAMYRIQTESKRTRAMLKPFRSLERNFLTKPYARTIYNYRLTKRFCRLLKKEGLVSPDESPDPSD